MPIIVSPPSPGRSSGIAALWATCWDSTKRAAEHVRLSPTGLVVAVLFVCLSLTPSLLPRTWQVQGVISGISGSIGYGVGVVTAWLFRRANRSGIPVSSQLRPALRIGVSITVTGLLALSLYYGSVWQRGLYELIGEPIPGRLGYVRVLLVSLLLVAAAVGFMRAVRALVRFMIWSVSRRMPQPSATIASVTAMVVVGILAVEVALHDGFMSIALSTSAAANETSADVVAPASQYRSGGPQSLVSWGSLGRQGRSFVAGGPTLDQLRAFGGAQAKEPIRVYVGLGSTPNVSAAAALAVRELERTGASSRSVLCVVTTTGTGWVDPYAAAALEYLFNGDTAIVGTQFSSLPSWISFLAERDRVAQAGRALFDQVYSYWSALPANHRPRLVVFGESLGSLGSEATFRDLDDVLTRTDGALWIGPTNANPLWRQLVVGRDAGSREVLPIVGQGSTVRFASRPQDLSLPTGPWRTPRVVYLQNASDPVTWWSTRLLYARPDWLAEPRGYDVQPAMRWYPVVTFLQVTADLVLAERTPRAHGHYFHGATVAAWAAVVQLPGWTDARTVELTRLLDQTDFQT